MKLLNINASPRGERSRTLSVTRVFLDSIKTKIPDLEVVDLDLFGLSMPEVVGEIVDAKYTLLQGKSLEGAAKQAWADVTRLGKQFLEADIYVISAPMWNFTVPYRLKHYIDVIMQPGLLFRFTEQGIEGLAKNKKMYCFTSRGSDYSNPHLASMDFQEPYLRTIFGMAGITDIQFVHAQPLDMTPELTEAALNVAREKAAALAI